MEATNKHQPNMPTKPMGIEPGVTHLNERSAYQDNELSIRYFTLAAGSQHKPPSKNRPLFYVFEQGRGTIAGQDVHPGQLLIVSASTASPMTASQEGLSGFVVTLHASLNKDNSTDIEVLDRIPLVPFEEECIIVSEGEPYSFDGRFNFAEVIVPPHVTTSQHCLTVNERYLMMGYAKAFLDNKTFIVHPGDIVHIPSGVMQSIHNHLDENLRFYCLCTPPFTYDAYIERLDQSGKTKNFNLQS